MEKKRSPGPDFVRHAPDPNHPVVQSDRYHRGLCGTRTVWWWHIASPEEASKPDWVGCERCMRILHPESRAKPFQRVASIRVTAFKLLCPYCSTVLGTGSEAAWPREELITCAKCHKPVRINQKTIQKMFQ